MKKLLTLVSAFALVLTSCSSEDDSSSSSNAPVLVTKTIESGDSGPSITTNFIYDGNKLIEWNDSDGERETFVYDSSGKITSGNSYYGGTFSIEYSYDSQDRLIEIKDNDTEEIFEYVYNSNGTITENRKDFDLILEETRTYTFLNGNITNELTEFPFGGSSNSIYTFDTNNNPFINMHVPYELFLEYFEENKNNVLSSTIDNDPDSFESFTCTYNFNSNGYPTLKTITYGDGSVDTIEYFYNQ